MNCETFVKFTKIFEQFKFYRKNHPELVTSYQQTGQDFEDNIERGISKAKVFEVEDGIKKLLCLTDPPNKNDEVKLPFESIFIDVEFTKEELKELGIEIDAEHLAGILFKEGILVNNQQEGIVGKDLNITMLSKQENGQFWFDNFNKNFTITLDIPEWQKESLKIKENPTTDTKAREFLHKFVINFLNFLNNPEVELVEHKRSEKNIERKKREGKVVIPSSMKIRLTGKLYQYIDELNHGEQWHYNYRFWVRGHFRKLQSNRYAEKKTIWIYPYIKGKGVLIEKSYILQDKKNT